MKGITITSIAALLALSLAACGTWRTGGVQGEKDSDGGLNAAQNSNRPATGARDVRQAVKDVQQPVEEIKQQVADTQGAKRHGKGVKRSTTGMRQDVKQQGAGFELQIIETRVDYGANGCIPSRCEDPELQVVETRDVEQLTIDVMRPTEDAEVVSKRVSVKVEELSVEPMDQENVKDLSDWPRAREIYLAVPERQVCPTPYWGWVELRVQ